MVDDINTHPDSIEYEPDDYADLSSSIIGESFREGAIFMEVLIGVILLIIFLTIITLVIYFMRKQ